MNHNILSLLLASTLLTTGCAATTQNISPESVTLASPDSADLSYPTIVASAPWTVFVFISASCPCLDSHLGRLHELAETYGRRGVQFIAVDSEVGTTKASARAEKEKLGLSFPVLVDHDARLANAFEAEFATYSVLVDRQGKIAYRGGIDSDKRKLHDDATPYLRDALDDVLAGSAPKRAYGKALGCILRKW